ncbi:MAG: polynucleotide adenylyltransferase PcnB, partial [Burkholderiaceae bacterium]
VREIVVDYHGGIKDAKKKLLRMIGDPATRYREDPVRIIRVVRFAAKLGFEIEAKTRAPIRAMAALLDNVPPSRTFDEMIKLLQTGHALASIEELRKQGLHRGVFPVLDVVLDEAHRHDGREKFVQLALADTDRRVNEGKPVAPSFMLACMLWHDVQAGWDQRKAAGQPATPALQDAIDAVFDARIGDISGRGKLAADMREIWMMQPRLERRAPATSMGLVEQPRFRAGFDFLRLRADAGEIDPTLGTWWESFSTADEDARHDLLAQMREREPSARRGAAPASSAARAPVADDAAEAPFEAAAAPRKRRRRRRRPGGGEGGDAPAGDRDPAPGSTPE